MLLFDLTPDRSASAGQIFHPDNGVVRIEMRFTKPLPDAITSCVPRIRQYSAHWRIQESNPRLLKQNGHVPDIMRHSQRPFLPRCLPSDILPLDKISQSGTIILSVDPHTEGVSYWLAIHIEPRFSTSFYFYSYGLPPFVPAIQSFLRRTCTIW
jgi:hypothetical protein